MRHAAVVVLGLCALAVSPASRAATIVYDLAGTTINESSTLAPSGVFTNPVGPGSSLTLDFDANADGVTGDVTIAASHIVLQHTDNFFGGSTPYGSLTFDAVAQLVGGHGQLMSGGPCYYDCIDWDTSATYSTTGTVTCFGPICSLLGTSGEPAGVPLPYSVYEQFLQAIGFVANPSPLSPGSEWRMAPDIFGHLDYICGPGLCFGTNRVTIATTSSQVPALWLDLEMQAVPEPPPVAALGAGFLLLALSGRRSGTMRRHEAR